MHINSLYIEKYKIFEKLKIDFRVPKESHRENGNIVNIIAGVNGSGKTSLLEWLYCIIGGKTKFCEQQKKKGIPLFDNFKMSSIELYYDENLETKISQENYNDYRAKIIDLKKDSKEQNGVYLAPRIIYIPSTMTFSYIAKTILNNAFDFANTINPNDLLGYAELFIKNYIITQERLSIKSNPTERTQDAVNQFNAIFEKSELITKLVNLDIYNNNRPIFETLNGDKITIDKLSSGEQQLYARVVSLMILNPHNSIILIDEPEIALHPKWQIEIMKIYANIGKNNQFIVTTHSPFIISQTHYLSLAFLVKEDNKIVAKQFKENSTPPHRDINTLVKTVMGADYLPKELEELQLQYRKLFDTRQEESEEAKALEKKILEWESPNSSFWQGLAFDRELRDL